MTRFRNFWMMHGPFRVSTVIFFKSGGGKPPTLFYKDYVCFLAPSTIFVSPSFFLLRWGLVLMKRLDKQHIIYSVVECCILWEQYLPRPISACIQSRGLMDEMT